MKILRLSIDSKILKRNIYELIDFESEISKFTRFEDSYRNNQNPYYVQICIDVRELDTIHFFEEHGFRFIELKIFKTLILDDQLRNTRSIYPFIAKEITEKSDFSKILHLLNKVVFEDRFSLDNQFDPELAILRNRAFLKRSFSSQNEFLLAFLNSVDQAIIGFQSGKFLDKDTVLLYLNGLASGLNENHYREISDTLLYNWLKIKKIRNVHALSSGVDLKELNLSLTREGYIIDSNKVILRKIYSCD
jgi:hypothetical protein